jgi:hypothetical protein
MSDNFLHHEVIHVETKDPVKTTPGLAVLTEDRLDQLELTVKNLSVINEALYEIIVAKLGVNSVDLAVMIDQVTANRSVRLEAKSTCIACGRLVSSHKQKCIYCGGELSGNTKISPFDQ